MCSSVAPLAPKGWFGAVLGNVSLCTTTASIGVAFPHTVVVLIVIISVGSFLICVHTLVLVFTVVCKLASVGNWAIIVVGHCGF